MKWRACERQRQQERGWTAIDVLTGTEQLLVCPDKNVSKIPNACCSFCRFIYLLHEKATQLIRQEVPAFKASDGWVYKLFRRNCFTLRAKTSLSQRLPAGLESKMTSYLQKVQKECRIGRFPNVLIGIVDEIPVYFDLILANTVERVGVKSCIICSTGAEKRHITAVLTVTADGSMLPLMIIFKGKRQLKLKAPAGVLVCVQPKGWMDKGLMEEYLKHIWQLYVEKMADQLGLPDHNALLVLDSFRAHTAANIEADHGTAHCTILGGCTSKLQLLDVSINKPFKRILKGCWTNCIHTAVTEAADQAMKIKTASKQHVLVWVVEAWERMKGKKVLITMSFEVTGITSADPAVVWQDHYLQRAVAAVDEELILMQEDSGEKLW